MKKFTLMAGLVALATVGSVFAAWQFSASGGNKIANLNGGVGVTLKDTTIEIDGTSGTLSIAKKTGDGKVEIVQSSKNAYSIKFEDATAESYTATYEAGIGEQINDYDYTITFEFRVKYVDTYIFDSAISYSTTAQTSPIQFSGTTLVAETTLSKLLEDVTRTPIALEKIGGKDVDTLPELVDWIEDFNANNLKIEVSASLSAE